MTRNKKGRSRKAQVQPVSIVDGTDSSDQLRIQRAFAAMDGSLSHINTILEYTGTLSVSSTGTSTSSISFPQFSSLTDFSAFATEYKLFRIKYILFDVYDTNPSSNGTAYFSTQHITTGESLSQGMPSVTAALDCAIVPPGTGIKTFTWVAKSNDETSFQGTNGTIQDYGGLVNFAPQATSTVSNRYLVIAKAYVQFRARI